MDEIIEYNGLADEVEERAIEETCNTSFRLGVDSRMDEDSNAADPELAATSTVEMLRAEAHDRAAFVGAALGALACIGTARELDRARMQCEDYRGIR